MFLFICLICPAAISTAIFCGLEKEFAWKSLLSFPGFTAANSIIVLLIMKKIVSGTTVITDKIFTFNFTVEFLAISVGVAVVTGLLFTVIKKNVAFNIAVRHNLRSNLRKKDNTSTDENK